MSEVRLVIREAEHDWSGTIHGSSADVAIAALSADPVTLVELNTACARFEKPTPNHSFFAGLSAGLCDEPYDAGIVIIDLIARLVVVDSTYSSPEPTGDICYHNGECITDTWLRYHLASDWLFISDRHQWQAVAEERRRDKAVHAVVDARSVLYGPPLLEFLAREAFSAYARKIAVAMEVETIPGKALAEHDDVILDDANSRRQTDDEITYDVLKEIHVAWLLTPRDDLNGVCPREMALDRREHLTWDLQDQAERWSLLGQCPPGLNESSFAFRFGGFGIHELVQYYDLVRELLWSSWARLAELQKTDAANNGPETRTVADFLTDEVPRLERIRNEWLETPNSECHGRTPRSIIDHERARLPEAMSGHDAIVDPDCPCCQMLADMPGPMFWHLDGCNMDSDFAFDLFHRTRDDWENQRRKWEEDYNRYEAEREERKRLELNGFDEQGEDSIWSSSFSVGDAADVPLGVRLFSIGGHLAELMLDIRSEAEGPSASPDAQRFIDQLNRDFGNLRELLQTSESSLAETLIEPVITRFTETLSAVSSLRPELTTKCESLTTILAQFVAPPLPD